MHGVYGLSHILGLCTYLGATIFLAIAIETVGRRADSPVERRNRLAELFKIYDPLSIGALGVAVVSGAYMITDFKQGLGAAYFAQVGYPLVEKLILAFFLIIFATWVSFGICHRVVNADLGALPVTGAELDRVTRKLRIALWLCIGFTVATLWVALRLGTPAAG